MYVASARGASPIVRGAEPFTRAHAVMEGSRHPIRSIGPCDGAVFDAHPSKQGEVAERLEQLAAQVAAEIQLSLDTIIESEPEDVIPREGAPLRHAAGDDGSLATRSSEAVAEQSGKICSARRNSAAVGRLHLDFADPAPRSVTWHPAGASEPLRIRLVEIFR